LSQGYPARSAEMPAAGKGSGPSIKRRKVVERAKVAATGRHDENSRK
jgi:hypothetical protein